MAQPQALRLIVSTRQQRTGTTLAWLLLLFATFTFSRSVMGLSLWGASVLSVLETFLFFFLADRANPRTPVPFLRGADTLSRVFVQAAAPLLVMGLVYLMTVHFKFGQSGCAQERQCGWLERCPLMDRRREESSGKSGGGYSSGL